MPLNSEKTHCPSGHPYEGDNLILLKVKVNGEYNGKVKRQCRECKRHSHKSKREREGAIPEMAQAAE